MIIINAPTVVPIALAIAAPNIPHPKEDEEVIKNDVQNGSHYVAHHGKLGDPSRRRKNIPELSRAVNTENGTNHNIYSTASGVRRSEPPKRCTTCGANEQNSVEVHISNSEDTAMDCVMLMRAAFTFPCDKWMELQQMLLHQTSVRCP